MRVALRHRSRGNFRFVDTGWSWSIFLGAGFFGLPLFFRGLALWGTLMLLLWLVQLAVPVLAMANGETLEWLLNVAIAGLCVYLGFRGNALSARHLLGCGYELADPDSLEARIASQRWGI